MDSSSLLVIRDVLQHAEAEAHVGERFSSASRSSFRTSGSFGLG